jgi:hypothetical protein
MANHGANQNKKRYIQPPAEDRYDSLEVAKKLACYRYWCHLIEERNTKLWNPPLKLPASIWNWWSSNYIQTHIKQTS